MKLVYDHPRIVDRCKSNGLKAYKPPLDFGVSSTVSEHSNFSLAKSLISRDNLEFVNVEENHVREPGLFNVIVG